MSRFVLDTEGAAPVLRVEGALTIAQCAEARAALMPALQTLLDRPGDTLHLDLSALDEIDGAGAQLLLALNAALAGGGHRPVAGDCPAAVLAVATALGAAEGDSLFGAARAVSLAEVA